MILLTKLKAGVTFLLCNMLELLSHHLPYAYSPSKLCTSPTQAPQLCLTGQHPQVVAGQVELRGASSRADGGYGEAMASNILSGQEDQRPGQKTKDQRGPRGSGTKGLKELDAN